MYMYVYIYTFIFVLLAPAVGIPVISTALAALTRTASDGPLFAAGSTFSGSSSASRCKCGSVLLRFGRAPLRASGAAVPVTASTSGRLARALAPVVEQDGVTYMRASFSSVFCM